MQVKRLLHSLLPANEHHLITGTYDKVGDIALISIPDQLQHRSRTIAQAILDQEKQIQVVLQRTGHHQGTWRVPKLRHIGGENRSETLHRESGIQLRLDVRSMYFSPRSSNERLRIAKQIQADEHVMVLCSGIAPFPLVIARHSQASTIAGIEQNTMAHTYAKQNLKLNPKVQHTRQSTPRIRLFHGDVEELLPLLPGQWDRVILPLPTLGHLLLDTAITAIRPGGLFHYYTMRPKSQWQKLCPMLEQACMAQDRPILSYKAVRCGHCGPDTFRTCYDLQIM